MPQTASEDSCPSLLQPLEGRLPGRERSAARPWLMGAGAGQGPPGRLFSELGWEREQFPPFGWLPGKMGLKPQ